MKRAVYYVLALFFSVDALFGAADVPNKATNYSISRRNLIRTSRIVWDGSIPVINHIQNQTRPQELSVLALRIQFKTDDNERTTGSGSFILDPPAEASIDPAPHDREYFQAQMQALSAYYSRISSGALTLNASVSEEVFTLNHTMNYYHPASGDSLDDRRLAELFRDAVLAADSAGVQFSPYDCFIIFHAGVGNDFDLGYDPTPSDIPSAFLSLEELKNQLAGNDFFAGIDVENGSFQVPEGIILPETESQEGYEIGLLGTMTLLFGFQLGLPALWDRNSGRSGIGRWGLMDQGSGNYNGLIPAQASAWEKVFLGWEHPVTIESGLNLAVACSRASSAPTVYKVPINQNEYFLIENRQYDANGDSVARGLDSYGREVVFRPDGRLEASAPVGVIVSVDEYDYGLPGSGILIWHVDEARIVDGLADNRVNTPAARRGVDLEEADGAQDIGQSYGLFQAGSGSDTGVLHDAWFADNEINMLANSSQEVCFGSNTYPSSRANSGADSHITISDFSVSDTVMHFSVSRGLAQDGFPGDFGPDQHPFPPLAGDLNGDDSPEAIVATREGYIYVWTAAGEPLFPPGEARQRSLPGGDTLDILVPLAGESSAGFPVSPILTGTTERFLVSADSSGWLRFWSGSDSDGDRRLDEAGSWNGPVQFSALAWINGLVLAGTEGGKVLAFTPPGDLEFSFDSNLERVTSFCRNGDLIVVSSADQGILCLDTEGREIWRHTDPPWNELGRTAGIYRPALIDSSALVAFGPGSLTVMDRLGHMKMSWGDYFLPDSLAGPALGDVDGDGLAEIAFSGGGQIWLVRENGVNLDYFPLPRLRRNTILSPPLLADADGDGNVDVIVSTAEGTIEAFTQSGDEADGFPLSTGSGASLSPCIADLDSDGDAELLAATEGGYLFVWDLEGDYSEQSVPWGAQRRDAAGSGAIQLSNESPPDSAQEDLLPEKMVYNYPNPATEGYTVIRYHLGRESEVRIRIFSLDGLLKSEYSARRQAGDNEFFWNYGSAASGVYLCEVKAVSESGEAAVRFRMAVVR